jgi:hypothetical protein
MQLSYELPRRDGPLLACLRVVFGSLMIVAIAWGAVALGRRDFVRHGRWMLRAYAVGMGAGTQALILLPWTLLVGEPGPGVNGLLMGAGWVVNLVAAEWIVRRR